MLRNVIEDYLTSIKELQLFLPFKQLLEASGYYDIHIIHGATEFGKDFIAKKNINGVETQFFFQLKVGDVNLHRFRNEIQPQILEACTNSLSHPNFNRQLTPQVVFVTSGNLLPPATIAFQEFNQFLQTKLHSLPVVAWEKEKLITDFLAVGIEPFFTLHRSPENIGRFFQFYSKITNDELIDCFEIEDYTKKWLLLDWQSPINKLQVFFESYFFSKILLEKEKHYEAVLILSSLIRVLIKNNKFVEYQDGIEQYFQDILHSYCKIVNSVYDSSKPLLLEKTGVFAIFHYPLTCLKTLELFSLHILTTPQKKDEIESLFFKLLEEHKGCYRLISDNYAICVVLTGLSLIKLGQTELLKKYLNNVCVWICDRYQAMGLSPIGSTPQEEIEQLLSEYLEGLSNFKNASSFIACVLLDFAYTLGDKDFYQAIANELRAADIVPVFYHVLTEDALFTYDHRSIVSSNDSKFSLDLKKEYTYMIQYEEEANKIRIRNNSLFFIMFLLRDRYFPTFMNELIELTE